MEAQHQQMTDNELDLACQKAVEQALRPFTERKSNRFNSEKDVRGTGADRNAR